jgi:tRNA-dihydrouridine synthase
MKKDITDHMTCLVETKGEYIGSREARKHIAWYLKGMKGAAAYRDEVNRATTLAKVIEIVNKALS